LLAGAAGAGQHDLRQHFRVEAVAGTHFQRFAAADHVDGQQHVVAALGHLPGAGGTGVEDVLAHVGQDDLRLVEGLRLTPAHEGQGARRGCGDPTRHRGVHETNPLLCGSLPHPAGGSRVDGGAIQHGGAAVQLCQQAVVAEVDARHVFARGEHGDHVVHTARRIHRGLRHRGACILQIVAGCLRQVEYGDVVAGFHQVGGHRATHVAQSDKCYCRHCQCSSAIRSQVRQGIFSPGRGKE
jgi:hypothetical protein